ncbi:MAG: DUF2868 domain-containing protein [Lysobacterales bacterium]|nr:MAG: DUF2868 domain-containing protein [Xanthomonadales bacterium]
MRESSLRSVLLVKAIEEVDRAGSVIPPGDRAHATRETLRSVGAVSPGETASDTVLARALAERAERLVGPLAQRHPVVEEALGRTTTPAWLGVLLMIASFATGVGLSALDGSKRIDILAFPFLGLMVWNLAVYAMLAISWLRRRLRPQGQRPARAGWLQRSLAGRLGRLVKDTSRVHAVLGQALADYASSWAEVGRPYLAQHARQWLHLAAAAVALGLVAGLYVRGLALRYEAGWESTFLGPSQVGTLVGLVYGPVAGWSGVELPRTVAEIEALRWTPTGGGANAAPWIHLIALSLACFVILPRLALAALARLALLRLGLSRRLPDGLHAYAADAFRGGGLVRSTGTVSVTPYAYEPAEASLAGLRRWLSGAAGHDVQLDRRTSLRYGEEDMAGPAFDLSAHRVADEHVLLLTLAATPEAENHGAVIAAARDAAHRARPPARVRVVVDEAPYSERMSGDATLAPRLEERRTLWRRFVAGYGLEPELVDLARAAREAPAAAEGMP